MRWVSGAELPERFCAGRETRIEDPALSETPPAREMASSRVTFPVAWKVRGLLTAPATVMGRLRYSTTETVTTGLTRIFSDISAVVIDFSSS